jgi:hypothetical protein
MEDDKGYGVDVVQGLEVRIDQAEAMQETYWIDPPRNVTVQDNGLEDQQS